MPNKHLSKFKNLLIFTILLCLIFFNTSCKKDTPKPNVPSNPTEISVNTLSEKIFLGEKLQLESHVLPADAKQEISWESSDNNIATVSNTGLVTGITIGDAYITVSSTINPTIFKVVKISVLHQLLEEEKYDISYIITAPGQDAATSISINYHAYNTKSFVEYTTADNPNFNNPKTIKGDGYYFTNKHENAITQFEARNVIRVTINNLTPNTEYIYRVNAGNNTYSETYRFRTAKGSGNKTSFLALSDVHYSELTKIDGTNADISEETITSALRLNPDIDFVLSAGDTVDTGGNANIWDIMYQARNSYNLIPHIDVPGNHEYYIRGTGMGDHSYFAAYNASPYNGIEQKEGSSCWFIHNDVLFIMLDNVLNTNKNEQYNWLENLLLNNRDKYVVITMHIPIYHQNTDRDIQYMKLFEKYSVDLVIAGHYHSHNYSPNYYDGQISNDNYLGVNYMTFASGGVKGMATGGDPATFAKGYIIDIENGKFNFTMINSKGEVSWQQEFNSKKFADVINETKENLIKSVGYSFNEDDNTLTINWSNKFYGNVEKITINNNEHEALNTEIYFPTPSYTKAVINNIIIGYDYEFIITITFKDGTKHELIHKINRSKDINLQATNITSTSTTLTFEGTYEDLDYVVKEYHVYVNGEFHSKFNYLKGMRPQTSYSVNNLQSNTTQTIVLVAYDYSGKKMYEQSIKFKTL